MASFLLRARPLLSQFRGSPLIRPAVALNRVSSQFSLPIRKMTTHEAVLCRSKEGWQKLTVESIATPTPKSNEVLVQVASAGLNYPDVLMCEERYQVKPPYPFSPGGELAGTVIAVGSDVKDFKAGDQIAAMTGWGAFQQKVCIAQTNCIKIPKGIPLEVASGLFFTYGTSLHAIKDRGELKKGETILILGASGGVGVAAIEISKALGATVIAAASTPEKLAVCKKFGADHLINYSTENLRNRVTEITGGKGVDVVYDAVGGSYAEPALRSMAWRGRYLVIGFVGGIPKIPLNLTLLKGCSIVGVFWGSFCAREPENYAQDVALLLKWVLEKKIKPEVTGKFPLKDAPKAIGAMAERKVVGKFVVVCDPSQVPFAKI